MARPNELPIRVLRIIARMNVGGPAVQVSGLARGFDQAAAGKVSEVRAGRRRGAAHAAQCGRGQAARSFGGAAPHAQRRGRSARARALQEPEVRVRDVPRYRLPRR